MPRSKTIKLFLMDGEPSGRIKCSLANWTGIAYKIPRTALDKCKDLDILKQSGVYFLFGTDKADNTVVYIGQAGVRKNGKGLLLRVQEAHILPFPIKSRRRSEWYQTAQTAYQGACRCTALHSLRGVYALSGSACG